MRKTHEREKREDERGIENKNIWRGKESKVVLEVKDHELGTSLLLLHNSNSAQGLDSQHVRCRDLRYCS